MDDISAAEGRSTAKKNQDYAKDGMASPVLLSNLSMVNQSFALLQESFQRYKVLLETVAPTYDENIQPGPPFDMFYQLELVSRIKSNISTLIDESATVWNDLEAAIDS